MVYPLSKINQKAASTGNGITTIVLDDEPAKAVAPGASVNLRLGKGSFHVPLEAKTGTWFFACTDDSVIWNAADEALIDNIGGAAVPGAIANGSKIAAIGDSDQQFRLNGETKDGPLIYRTAGMVMIQRPEGQTVYEVTVSGAGGVSSGATAAPTATTAEMEAGTVTDLRSVSPKLIADAINALSAIPIQATAPDPADESIWFDNTGGGLVLNISDGSSWFAIG
jgi:hypothetical protein